MRQGTLPRAILGRLSPLQLPHHQLALAVRFTHGGHVEERSSWELGKDKQGLRIRRVSATVAAGPCSIQLLLEGRPLSWSRVVEVLPGKKHYVYLPDVERLK